MADPRIGQVSLDNTRPIRPQSRISDTMNNGSPHVHPQAITYVHQLIPREYHHIVFMILNLVADAAFISGGDVVKAEMTQSRGDSPHLTDPLARSTT